MSSWLDTQVRYYREQAEDARLDAAKRRSPKWVEREKRQRQLAVDEAEFKLRLAREMLTFALDDDAREREARLYDERAERWDALAAEHSTYAERKEAGLFDEADA